MQDIWIFSMEFVSIFKVETIEDDHSSWAVLSNVLFGSWGDVILRIWIRLGTGDNGIIQIPDDYGALVGLCGAKG